MNEKNNLFSATGIPSLFLIFAVLMLVILSLLGYGTSRQDLQSSTLSLKQNTAYYDACSQATDFYSEMVQALEEFQKQAKTEDEYYALAADYFNQNETAAWDSDAHTIQYMISFSDTQSLVVKIAILWYNADNNFTDARDTDNAGTDTAAANTDGTDINSDTGSLARILSWNTVVTADWNPDNSQSVYKGE